MKDAPARPDHGSRTGTLRVTMVVRTPRVSRMSGRSAWSLCGESKLPLVYLQGWMVADAPTLDP